MINLCRDERGKWRWPTNGADLVCPGIYLGDETTALCTGSVPPTYRPASERGKLSRILREMGVTAVLNAAQGNLEGWSMVNTKEAFYRPHGIKFLGVPGVDLKTFPLADYFYEAADFIDGVVRQGGRVLVHCVQVATFTVQHVKCQTLGEPFSEIHFSPGNQQIRYTRVGLPRHQEVTALGGCNQNGESEEKYCPKRRIHATTN